MNYFKEMVEEELYLIFIKYKGINNVNEVEERNP